MVVKELFAKLGLDLDTASFVKATTALGLLKVGMDAVAAVAKHAAEELFNLVGETAAAGAEVSRTAQKLGLTTDALQELRNAAGDSGVSAEALETGLRVLSRNAYEAANGSKEAALHFRAIGVSTRDSNGHLRSTDELLALAADRFAAMPDGVKKTALAMQVFGRGGAEMIPLLNKGSDGIEEMRERARQLGIVMDADLIQRSKEYIEVNREFNDALEGLKLALVGPFVRASALKKAFVEWWIAHRQIVAAGAERFFRILGNVLRGLLSVVTFLVNLLEFFATTTLGRVIAGVAAVTYALHAFSAAALLAGLKAAGAGILAAAPWALLAVVIGAIALLLEDMYVTMEGGDSVLSRHSAAILKFFDDLLGPLADIDHFLRDIHALWDLMSSKTTSTGSWLKTIAGGLTGNMALQTQGVAEAVVAQQFGGGASPAASAGASPSRGGAPVVAAPVIQQTINAAPGQSEERIADISRQLFEDVLNTQFREAQAAVSP